MAAGAKVEPAKAGLSQAAFSELCKESVGSAEFCEGEVDEVSGGGVGAFGVEGEFRAESFGCVEEVGDELFWEYFCG